MLPALLPYGKRSIPTIRKTMGGLEHGHTLLCLGDSRRGIVLSWPSMGLFTTPCYPHCPIRLAPAQADR